MSEIDLTQQPESLRIIDAAAERIRLRLKRSAEDIVAIGLDLLLVKERLGHGEFKDWIDAEFSMTLRTAERFMCVAERFPKDDIVSLLSASALYELAAPSTPESVIETVKERTANGEIVTTAEIKRLKAANADLFDETVTLRNDKALLADEVVELRHRIERTAIPSTITVMPDKAALENQYRALVAHWRSLPPTLQDRFLEEHRPH